MILKNLVSKICFTNSFQQTGKNLSSALQYENKPSRALHFDIIPIEICLS